MELRDYDPWPAVGGAQDFASFMKRSGPESDGSWRPVLEAFHNERELVLRFEISGVAPADIDLRVDNRVLYVRGVRRPSDQPPPELLLRDERCYGPFDRSIALPEGTAAEAIRATYLHGVLDVRVPHNRRPDAIAVPTIVENLDPITVNVVQND
jgi:HSP20 family molecular chaperone IbpA